MDGGSPVRPNETGENVPDGPRCKECGLVNPAPNGYCPEHQHVAVWGILQRIGAMRAAMAGSPGSSDLRQKMDEAEKSLREARGLCEADGKCSVALRNMGAAMQLYLNPTGSLLSGEKGAGAELGLPGARQLEALQREIDALSSTHGGQFLRAREVSTEWEAAVQAKEQEQRKLDEARAQIAKIEQEMREKEAHSARLVSVMREKVTEAARAREESEKRAEMVQKQLSECGARSLQVSGEHAAKYSALQKHVDELTDSIRSLRTRENELVKHITKLNDAHVHVEVKERETEERHRQAVLMLRDKMANECKGGHADNSVEAELRNKLLEAEHALEEAKRQLDDNETQMKRLVQSTDAGTPGGCYGALVATQEEMKTIQFELDKAHQDRQEFETKLKQAREELGTLRNAQSTGVEDLSSELAGTNQQIRVLSDIVNRNTKSTEQLQRRLQELNIKYTNDTRSLKEQVTKANREKLSLLERMRVLESDARTTKERMGNYMEDVKKNAERKLREGQAVLHHYFEETRRKLEGERTQLNHQTGLLEQQMRQLKERMALEERAMRMAEESRLKREKEMHAEMRQFEEQRNDLMLAVAHAREQTKIFVERERAHEEQIRVLSQKVNIERNKYDQETRALRQRIGQLEKTVRETQHNLLTCSGKREALQLENRSLRDRNEHMRMQFNALQARMETMRSKYEASMERMRTDSARVTTDLQRCAQQVRAAALGHDHVSKMREEALRMREQLKRMLQDATEREEALKQLSADREIGRQEMERLKAERDAMRAQRKSIQEQLATAERQKREMTRAQNDMARQLAEVRGSYQQVLASRDAAASHEVMSARAREKDAEMRLKHTELEKQELLRQASLARIKEEAAQRELLESESGRVRQLQRVIDAQRAGAVIEGRTTPAHSMVNAANEELMHLTGTGLAMPDLQ